jgi:hypothetical protein
MRIGTRLRQHLPITRFGWHYQLRATMAAAIEALINAQAGKAVRA